MKKILALLLLAVNMLSAQNITMGTLLNTPEAYNGFTLFAPVGDTVTYMIDNCGNLLHTWPSSVRPSNSVYMIDSGAIVRPGQVTINPTFGGAGVGGRIEKIDWDGNLLWQYDYSDSFKVQHHDITPMPNGNVLMVVWQLRTAADAIAAGRDSAKTLTGYLWDEVVVEVQPTGSNTGTVVWEWHLWDHVIQHLDSTKPNYGPVAQHPELVDFNYITSIGFATADWVHFNSIDYNAERDEILLSSRFFSEIYIIDHSTTTAQAALHTGGAKGKGGDLLYRWGNPEVYKKGTVNNQKLFGQHNAKWIPAGYPYVGQISLFNNGLDRIGDDYSTADVLNPLDANGAYALDANGAFLPDSFSWEYKAQVPTSFYDNRISGAVQLPNGNMAICSGTKGKFFEVTTDGTKVWEYISPVSNTGILTQGDTNIVSNTVFIIHKLSPDDSRLSGKVILHGAPIELNPVAGACTLYTDIKDEVASLELNVYPVPADEQLVVDLYAGSGEYVVRLLDIDGKVVYNTVTSAYPYIINLGALSQGMYVLQVQQGSLVTFKKLIIMQR